MMTQREGHRWAGDDGWFVASVGEAAARGPGPCVLSPLTALLPPRLADMACALPIGDANAQLLEALPGVADTDWVVAAVLAGDPFRRVDDLLDAVAAAGARSVINWPSVGLLSGELGTALAHSGFDYARELDMLERAQRRGLAIAAVVSDPRQLVEAAALRPNMLLLVPGLITRGNGTSPPQARTFMRLLETAASRAGEVDRRAYHHPAMDGQTRLPAGLVNGVIRHPGAP